MKNFSSALLSNYIIDGVPQALSPLEMLNDIAIEKLRVKGEPDMIAQAFELILGTVITVYTADIGP